MSFTAAPSSIQAAERLTLGVLMSGVAALALSDFVSPLYWSLPTIAAILRWWKGIRFSLTEMQASFIGWFGFFWVGLELAMGRAWVVAFTDFLLILALAVVVETATPRNHLHRMLTGLFLILAGAVLTDSVLYAIPLVALMWFTWRSAACLYGLKQPGGDLPNSPIRIDLLIMMGMISIALTIFIVLPRFDIQSKLQPTQPRMETTGFSDQVQLGDFARELDATVVLRVEGINSESNGFHRQIIGRYWRGVALSQYINYGWRQSPEQHRQTLTQNVHLNDSNTNFDIAVFREASDHPYILLPNGFIEFKNQLKTTKIDALGQLQFTKAPARRLRLVMTLDQQAKSRNHVHLPLRLPIPMESNQQHIPNIIHAWTQEIINKDSTPQQALQSLTSELRSWIYDLNAPLDANQPLASFIQNKRGHCELYATTLALAARTLGVPSRIINGYYGGEWNDTGQFFILRQQHAHSWVEVWLNGQWQRIDPTPASRWQMTGVQFPAWDEVWELVKLTWYRYILEFQSGDRERLFKAMIAWLKIMIPWLLTGVFILVVCSYLYSKLHLLKWCRNPYSKQQRTIDRWLMKHGIQRPLSTPLRALTLPQDIHPKAWSALVQQWEQQVYGHATLWSQHQLKRHLRALSHKHC